MESGTQAWNREHQMCMSALTTKHFYISLSIGSYNSFVIQTYLQRDLRDDAIHHEDTDLRLGAGYTSAERSRKQESNTVQHGDDRIRLGVKYHTQGIISLIGIAALSLKEQQ